MSKELRGSLRMKIVEGFLRSVPKQADKKVDEKIYSFVCMFVENIVWLSPFSLQNSA